MSVVLDLGQYWGWLASPQFVPWLAGLVISFSLFALWGTLASAPLINLRVLAKRNFTLGLAIKMLFSIDLLVLLSLLTGYMINLRGYQWWQASLVLAPACATMLCGIVLGALIGTDANRKLRIAVGLVVMSSGTAALATVDLYTAKTLIGIYLAFWGAGAGLVIGPALLTAFETLSPEETLHVAGFFNIARSLPAFIVGATLAILLTQNTDAQFDVLRQNIRFNRAIVESAYSRTSSHFATHGNPSTTAEKQAQALVGKWVHANARAFALQGILAYLSLVPLIALLLVPFIYKAGAEIGPTLTPPHS
jgi:DHA2 family multidrug resistance protein